MTGSRILPLVALLSIAAARADAQDGERSLNPLGGYDKGSLKHFVEQPLFDPSRHPPVVAAPVIVELPPPPTIVESPPSLRILGVVEGPHSLAAVVHRDDTGKTETLHPGDQIGSWTVQVLPTGVRVQSGSRTFDYALFRGPQAGPMAVTSPTPDTVTARDLVREH